MTASGVQTFEEVDAQAKAMRAEIALDVSTDEIRVALNVVRRLTTNLQKLSEEEATS